VAAVDTPALVIDLDAIAVDSAAGVARLAQAMNEARQRHGTPAVIDVFVEIDVDQGRCGVPPGEPAVQRR